MEAAVTRPAIACCRRVVTYNVRHKSTAARTRRALNIPPHPSFLTSSSDRPTTDEIIYNPPSSAASVYHTPFKFLPKSDPRRRANLASEIVASSTTIQYPTSSSSSSSSSSSAATSTEQQQSEDSSPSSSSSSDDPVPFPSIEGAPRYKARHHLTKADIEEMRRLRAEDPATHTVQALSRRFQCSKLFVMMCCQAPKEHKDKVRADLERVKQRWGPRRQAAREERRARMGLLFQGEL
ncbi:hypothetical protein VTH82DRAFT_5756 [Thermothelomyces myriococcoides]